MNVFRKLEIYGDTHHPKWLDLLRIILGLLLLFKGIDFVSDTQSLTAMLSNSQFAWVSLGLAHYVAFAHLVGGIFIALGLMTRMAVLVQLPILIGAVVFINAQKGFYSENSELLLSVIVLALLVFFLVYGSGPISVDNAMRKTND